MKLRLQRLPSRRRFIQGTLAAGVTSSLPSRMFGSAAGGVDFTDESDIDLLVEYDSDFSPPPLSEFFQFRRDLSSLLSRQIDLTMAGAVRNPYVREAIERSRQMLHGA